MSYLAFAYLFCALLSAGFFCALYWEVKDFREINFGAVFIAALLFPVFWAAFISFYFIIPRLKTTLDEEHFCPRTDEEHFPFSKKNKKKDKKKKKKKSK